MDAQEYAEIKEQLGIVCDRTDRLCKLLEGNGQPGFIAETREEIQTVQTWQATHDAEEKVKSRHQKKLFAIWTGIIATLTVLIEFGKAFFE
jgi:hypothetical protein